MQQDVSVEIGQVIYDSKLQAESAVGETDACCSSNLIAMIKSEASLALKPLKKVNCGLPLLLGEELLKLSSQWRSHIRTAQPTTNFSDETADCILGTVLVDRSYVAFSARIPARTVTGMRKK